MFVERNGRSPSFTEEELTQIFGAMEAHTTRAAQETARRLYPGREEAVYEGLYLSHGPGRAFPDGAGGDENPQYLLMSWPCGIGILKDGSVRAF